MKPKRVQGTGPVRTVDGGRILVETVGPWFVQDGPTDNDRVRFRVGDRARVTAKLRAHLLKGRAAVVVKQPKKKGPAPENKALQPDEDKLFDD